MKLFDFQKRGLELVEGKDRVAFYWEMGTGKTFVGSEKMWSFNNKINLIVCQKSKVRDWVEHMTTHYSGDVYDLTNKRQFDLFLQNLNGTAVINYDLLHRRPILQGLSDFTLMLDESQYIANESARRTKFVLRMRPKNVVLLSGTPVSGKYEQLWSQCRLLGWKITKNEFWRNYVVSRDWYPVEGMFPVKIVVGYKNVDDLKFMLRRHGATFLKTEEVIDLPEQVFQTIHVPTTAQYRKFMKNGIVDVGGKWESYVDESGHDVDYYTGETLVGDTLLTKMLYARQLCSSYNKDKLDAFKDLIESTSSRVVVFYNFNKELEALKKIVADRPRSIVNGETRDLTAFREHDDGIALCQYQAAAEGLNLQEANHIVYFSPPLSSAKFEQSKKRIHRIGQSKTCFYYYLVAKGSVEEKIYDSLAKGKDYTEKLFEHD